MYSFVLILTFSLAVAASLTPQASDILHQYSLPSNQLGATVFSLIYGTPLSQFAKEVASTHLLEFGGTNKLFDTGKLSSPALRVVVEPNVDTVYGLVIFDVALADMVVNVPPFQAHRFYLFAFFDP